MEANESRAGKEYAMAWIETVAEENADGELARLYRRCLEPQSEQVDNILKTHSLHPEGLKAHLELYRAVMKGTRSLPKVEREMIALVVSQINRCHY